MTQKWRKRIFGTWGISLFFYWSQTGIATDRLIDRYKAEGYEFVTIPDMMGKPVVSSQPAVPG